MIIARAPLRISFVGGGSDLPAFCAYEKGHVVSAAIDKYVYVAVNERHGFDAGYRISYMENEVVWGVDDIQHDIVRECIKRHGDGRILEVVSTADLPDRAGLGSSGAFTVALIQALIAKQGRFLSPRLLIEAASKIEMQKCGKPIGYQDQAAASYGGINFYTFSDGGVYKGQGISDRENLEMGPVDRLFDRLLLVDVGVYGPSNGILARQSESLTTDVTDESRVRASYRSMANMAHAFRDSFVRGYIDECGEILDASWQLKKSFDAEMSNPVYNDLIDFAKSHGAIGGKLCGAGGRGMVLLYSKDRERDYMATQIWQTYRYDFVYPRLSLDAARPIYSSH